MFQTRKTSRKNFPKLDCSKVPTLTEQNHKRACDINFLVNRYKETGSFGDNMRNDGEYVDASNVTFHEAMNLVTKAQQQFDELPSHLRKRFANNPGEFLDFINDDNNIEEARKLGLIPPEGKTAKEVREETPGLQKKTRSKKKQKISKKQESRKAKNLLSKTKSVRQPWELFGVPFFMPAIRDEILSSRIAGSALAQILC